MTALLLSLASAATFGAADFLGGLATRRSNAVTMAFISQIVGLAVLAVAMSFLPGTPSGAAFAWGALAGIGGSLGLVCYFTALSMGTMGIAAPIASLVGAILPVVVGLGLGERPGALAGVGVAVGIAATVLVSLPSRAARRAARAEEGAVAPAVVGAPVGTIVGGVSTPGPASAPSPAVDGAEVTAGADQVGTGGRSDPAVQRRALLIAAASGFLFGIFFVALDRAPDESGLWPLVGGRMALVLLGGILLVRRPPMPDRQGLRLGALSGMLDMCANIFFLLATREGLLVLTTVVTGLYPVGVVLLAALVLGERLTRVQVAGVAMALGATVLIAI